MNVCAFDFSLRSPGVCAYGPDIGHHLFAVYAGPDREEKCEGYTVHLLHLREPPDAPDILRYELLIDTLLPRVMALFTAPEDVDVVIESYAFVHRRAGSNYKLHEVTGILKWELKRRFGVQRFCCMSSYQWRSAVFGSCYGIGKCAALEYFQERTGKQIDLFALCNRKKKEGEVPTPVQDLCEALCICDAFLKAGAPKKERKRKKPSPAQREKKKRK
jgi:hypothetical protein